MRLEKIDPMKIKGPELDVRADVDLERLNELADSIKEIGLLQPIVVRANGDGYEVVTGNRRRLACRMIGLGEAQCIVLEQGEDTDLVGMRLHENLIRQDLTPVEEAAVYAELFERVEDVDKVAALVHRSREIVERRLLLLSGDPAVRDALHAGRISTGVAEELNRVVDAGTRGFLLEHAIRGGVTVSTAAAWRRQYAQVRLSEINISEPPQAPDAPAQPVENVYVCWLCGSTEDPHDMRARMVHQSCERLWRRSQEAQGGGNGQT